MWVKHFRCKNVGPHRELDLALPRGLIGVFGPNGAGKSSLLNLMYACLSNDFGRFHGTKDECVFDRAEGTKIESFVALEVEHRGVEFSIRRDLPKGHELLVRGATIERLTDARKIQERLGELLGEDARSLDLFVFKAQNRIYDHLETTDGKRKEAFQALCGTEKCATIHDLLGEVLGKDAELNAVVVDDSDELQRALGELRLSRDELVAEQATWLPQRLNATSLASAQQILKQRQRHLDLAADRDQVTAALAAAVEAEATARRRHANRQEKTAQLRAAWAATEADYERARGQLQQWTSYDKQRKRFEALEREREALVAEPVGITEVGYPAELPADFDLDAAIGRQSVLQAELARAEEIVAAFDDAAVLACPTCGTPTKKLAGYLTDQRALIAAHPEAIAVLQRQIARYQKYQRQAETYARWRADYTTRRKANAAALQGFDLGAAPATTKAAVQAVIDAHLARLTAHEESQLRGGERAAALAAAEATRKTTARQLAELSAALEASRVPDAKHDKAKARLAEHQAAEGVLAKLEGRLQGVDEVIAAREADLARLKVRLKRSRRVRRQIAVLERVREAAHRNNLPNVVAQIVLGRLEGAINRDLALFGDPFWVESRDDLTFDVHRPGRPAEPSGRLSIGQKVVLSIPFWFAWRSEIGMLCLDEPTANLDADNQAYLATALATLAATVRGTRQVILVSHADGLRSSFDRVIDLGAAGGTQNQI